MLEKTRRIKELVETLNRAAFAYEQQNTEIMSNYAYDQLYDELLELEKETGILLSNSPTIKVGYAVLSELPKEKHEAAMLSLDKTKEVEALKAFLNTKEGILSWKMDGLTIVLTYRGGVLEKAVTRGNGEIGEVVTSNAKVFQNVPLSIPYKGEMVLRGEAIIRYSDFEEINAEIEAVEAKFKNPRNLCSGAVRQLNSEVTAKRRVRFYAFALIRTEADLWHATRQEQMDWLAAQGFHVVENRLVEKDTLDDAITYFSGRTEKNDFPSDGLVLAFNDIAYGLSLGRTSKFPRDSIAFKWRDEIRDTKLLSVEWSASRTGLINPIAVFEPVELEGTTVSRASLHNISIMEGLALGISDVIQVYKANMIIPQVAENLTRSGTVEIPAVCPVCGKETTVKDENGVKVLLCGNEDCAAKKIKAFNHFVSRDAMNIEGLSEATIEKFVQMDILHEPADLFHLKEHQEMIEKMEGFGKRSYENLILSVEKARTVTLPKFIYSLGIANIGLSYAKLICKACKNDLEQVMQADRDMLLTISGIGGVIADAFAAYFEKEKNRAAVLRLRAEVVFEAVDEMLGKLEGKTFVITGSMELYANRNALKEAIEAQGGKVSGSVSAKTHYLINNDALSNSAKNKKAKELGVSVITEKEFRALLEEHETEINEAGYQKDQ